MSQNDILQAVHVVHALTNAPDETKKEKSETFQLDLILIKYSKILVGSLLRLSFQYF